MTEQTDEYLETLYRLEEVGKKATTTNIAKELNLSPSSVTEMLKKLSARGYIEYTPYKGAVLTESGRKRGGELLRKHRILEKFLVKLGIKQEKAHEEACKLEHALSDDVEKKLSNSLGNPKRDSEGEGTPSSKCSEPGITSLLGLSEGDSAEIVCLYGGIGLKRHLRSMGIMEGKIIKLITKQPGGGPIVIRVGNTETVIGRGKAMKIMVRRKV
jgi:DtxR family Mn-dependent transcriptional regulator